LAGGPGLRKWGAIKLLGKKLVSSSDRVVSSALEPLKDVLPPLNKNLDDPEEKELDESKSTPVFLNLTDFISFKKAAILSGVTPMVG
jgi:hypothetical protein